MSKQLLSKSFIISYILVVFILAGGALLYQMFKSGPLKESYIIYVQPNSNVQTIVNELVDNNVIESPHIFKLLLQSPLMGNSLKAGEYQINEHASLIDLVRLLKQGKSLRRSFTVVEGQTHVAIIENLKNNPYLTGDIPKEMPPEGWLLADTIYYFRGASRESIIKELALKQQQRVNSIWQKRDKDLPIKTIEEFVILASIVEKESSLPEEQPMVAGVFINRLKKSMRLQSDVTVVYGIWRGAKPPEGFKLYNKDLNNKNEYNTYKILGLPIGAIANPSTTALQAVAHPAKTKALYFVSNGMGKHNFSETLVEHNQNVQQWREYSKGNNGK
ncbi:endolytic transglycosylase MltG [Bartonella sp. DGB1]|uniref:endolytic transglycosylase MltG n=1 Tax=Bartonella sp. DGB1 TaxID=3239807 RepID=UPI0035247831